MENTGRNNEDNINKNKVNFPSTITSQCRQVQTPRTQETCYCCKHYGRSCLQNNSNKVVVETSHPLEVETSKGRKSSFQDQQLRSHSCPFLISPQESQPQAHGPHCPNQSLKDPQDNQFRSNNILNIDVSDWIITYSEFRPRNRKHPRKHADDEIKPINYQSSKNQRDRIKEKKVNYLKAQVNYVQAEQARQAPDVLLGEILMYSKPVTVLFDPRASHSFISTKVVEKHNLISLVMRRPVTVQLSEKELRLRHGCPGVQLQIVGAEFKVDVVILDTEGIDIILGRNWLSKCKGVMDYHRKTVCLTNRQGVEIKFVADISCGEYSANEKT